MNHRAFYYLMMLLLLGGCGGGGGGGSAAAPANAPPVPAPTVPPPTPPPAVAWFVADPGSAHRDVLEQCVRAESAAASCTLTRLPLLGQETVNPSVNDVLSRTVVSHTWMADRFRQILANMPADVLALMKGVTAVVIASDIRPSYYSPESGAIYIDPYFLWVTRAEYGDVSAEPDFREDFGLDMSYVPLFRYVIGTDYAWNFYDPDGTDSRLIVDVERELASLLFHELAHANDAVPPTEVIHLDSSMTISTIVRLLEDQSIAAQLTAAQPLNSQVMRELADVLYFGAPSSDAQRALTGSQVGLEFEADGASDDYAYSAEWEDLAMLFEEVMMRYHYGADRELAFTNLPVGDDALYCDSYFVDWGVRNRVGNPLVLSRATFAMQQLMNVADVSGYLQGMPTQWRMVNGRDWCTVQNRTSAPISPPGKAAATAGATETNTRIRPRDLSAGYL